jgi:hypothetical protein
MSDSGRNPSGQQEARSQGPNLVLVYGLIALALVAASVLAWMIVMPFYLRR